MVDPWTIALFILYLSIAGPSPFIVPLVSWIVFWEQEGNWKQFTAIFGDCDVGLYCVCAPLLTAVVYWVNGGFLLIFDTVFATVARDYKIQPRQHFDTKLMKKVVSNILFNQVLVVPPFAASLFVIKCITGRGAVLTWELPSHQEMTLHTIGFICLNEILFYYGHRMLHQSYFYKKVHKVHHEFKSPIALVAIYCHPFEMLVANMLPLFSGFILLNSHAYTQVLWLVFAVLGTQTHHCGVHWPWLALDHQPTFHDLHHEKFNCNFGNVGLLDALHGTDKEWKAQQAKAAERNAHTRVWDRVGDQISRCWTSLLN